MVPEQGNINISDIDDNSNKLVRSKPPKGLTTQKWQPQHRARPDSISN